MPIDTTIGRVVVLIQENKTPDFYFPSLAAWGADVAPFGALLGQPPDFDQPHDRNAWVHFAVGDYPGVRLSIDNDTLIPYYSWLAKTFVFSDHHFGAGTNSTPGHLMTFTGQTPTFRNPPFTGPHPVWDLPTVMRLAERSGHSWGAFVDGSGYPANLVAELSSTSAHANIHGPGGFTAMAHAGTLPDLCYVWSPSGYDEHPPLHPGNTGYVKQGHDLVWGEVDAVVAAGEWPRTLFILTWDDWGGYADHVVTPPIFTLPDAVHPNGFQAVGGSRIPLIMFGAMVPQAIDTAWHSHASIAKTAIDALGLPPLGVPQVDGAPTMIGLVDHRASRPEPPAYRTVIAQPRPPVPTPRPVPPGPWPGIVDQPMPAILLNGGGTLPPPSDGIVHPKPPHLPRGAGGSGTAGGAAPSAVRSIGAKATTAAEGTKPPGGSGKPTKAAATPNKATKATKSAGRSPTARPGHK